MSLCCQASPRRDGSGNGWPWPCLRCVIPMARIDDRFGFGAERGAPASLPAGPPPSWRPAAGRGPGRLDAGGPAGKDAGAPKQGGPTIGHCFGPLVSGQSNVGEQALGRKSGDVWAGGKAALREGPVPSGRLRLLANLRLGMLRMNAASGGVVERLAHRYLTDQQSAVWERA